MTLPFSKTFWYCILWPSEKLEKAHLSLDFPSIKYKREALAASVEKAAGSATMLLRARSGAASPGSCGFRCRDALRRPGSDAARRSHRWVPVHGRDTARPPEQERSS